jgi:hypothetical protein
MQLEQKLSHKLIINLDELHHTYTIMKRIDIRVHHLCGVCWFHQLKPQNPLLLHVFFSK